MATQKWILFDIGGVLELVDDDTWQDEWWARWHAHSGLTRAEFDRRIAEADLPRIDITTGTSEEFWRRLGEALALTAADLAAMQADFWDAYCGSANTEMFAYAATIAPRARLAILSNSVDGAREEEERRFGLSVLFDPICYSHEQGVNKPDPAAYRRALGRMQARAEDVFFIDDHIESVNGAAAVGIRGILQRDNAATIAAVEEFLRS